MSNAQTGSLLAWTNDGVRGRQVIQRLDQEVSGEWLTKESDTAGFPGSSFDLVIVVAGHEYYGECDAGVCKLTYELNTTTVAQLDIDDEANRLSGHHRLKEFAG